MVDGNSALAWLARVRRQEGPLYLAIVRALEQAIAEGELQPGDRLPAQRDLAARLGVDFTTITRAYSVARTLGLLDGAVGRGSFVRARTEDDEAGLVDLSMNLPPPARRALAGGDAAGNGDGDPAADRPKRADGLPPRLRRPGAEAGWGRMARALPG
ncbi:MAG: winged helix-turn-helix domain-containing protein [Caulobacteraceae bacterium]